MVWRDWQPQSPTLIVIDYIGSRNIGRVLKILSQRNNLNHPVRMLLLEREGMRQGVKDQYPKWFQDILHEDKPLISDHWHDWMPMPIPTLPGMNDDDLWTLMRLFLGDQAGHLYTREVLFEQLTRIDSRKRP